MTALATWVWQGAVVAAVAALLVQVVPQLNAATKHVIWWVALLMVIVHPWTPSAVPPDTLLATAGTAAAGSVLLVLPSPPAWAIAAALVVWRLAVSLRLVQIVRGVLLVRELKQGSHAFDPERELRLRMWNSVRETGRRPSLRVSSRAGGPCALGLGHPVILLPAALAGCLSDAELDQVVMHEHAHVTRYDDWSRLFQCVVASLVGLHPALWFIGTQIDLEREAACDDDVVARTGAPRAYAGCLTRAAAVALESGRRTYAVIPVATGSAAALRARITRLLNVRADRTPRLRWVAAAASSAALAIAVVGSDQIPPLVVFIGVQASASTAPAHASRTVTAMPLFDTAAIPSRRATPRRTPRAGKPVAVAMADVRTVSTGGHDPGHDGEASVAAPADPPPLIESRPVGLAGPQAWLGAPAVWPARPPARTESVGPDHVFRMIGARAARAGLAAAGRARGLGEAVSSSFVAAGSGVARKF